MIETFFAFSDETGNYKREKSQNFCRKNPYYIRGGFIITVPDWRILKDKAQALLEDFNLPKDKELKWSYLWSVFKYKRNNKNIPEYKPYHFLADYSFDVLKEFVKEMFKLYASLDSVKTIYTFTKNQEKLRISESALVKMHLQELMQRIEMEIQTSESMATLAFDETDGAKKDKIRRAYCDIYNSGDFIAKYTHIKDSMSFELSHQSVGIKMADYICGAFRGCLQGFNYSKEVFASFVYPKVRRSKEGELLGYGIREVPKNEAVRGWLREKLRSVI